MCACNLLSAGSYSSVPFLHSILNITYAFVKALVHLLSDDLHPYVINMLCLDTVPESALKACIIVAVDSDASSIPLTHKKVYYHITTSPREKFQF